MTPEASPRPGLHPSIVLSAYVEPLVRGRRVAILGDATLGLADELGQRGARLVHVYDPDPARTAEALARTTPGRTHQVSYAVLAGDLGVRDGAFDVVVVPDLGLFPDPAEALRRARRLCSQAGVAVFVAPNAGGAGRRLLGAGARAAAPGAPLGYYELYDLVSLQFAKVRMIGQAPFVGYTVADFTLRGEPEVSVDTSLLASSEEPEHFIALASDRPVSLDAYAVIELPWRDVAAALGAGDQAAAASAADRRALVEAEARVGQLGAELDQARARIAEQARAGEEREKGATALSARVAELEAELLAREARQEARVKETEARAGDNHVRAERLQNQIRDLDEELRRQRDRGTKLSKLLDDEKKARTKAELELGMLRGVPGAKERADALAAELLAAQSRIADLELELTKTPRRMMSPPVTLVEAGLDQRVAELEQELEATRGQAAQAVAHLDAARADASRAAAQREAARQERDAARADAARAAGERELARQERDAARADAARAAGEREAARQERDAARAEVGRVAAERDGALADRARQGGAEAQVADLVRDNEELARRLQTSAAAAQELSQQLAAERDREQAAARAAAEGARRLAEAERQAGEAARKAAEAARALAEAEKRAAGLATRVAEREAQVAELGEALAREKRAGADEQALREAVAEIAALESALRERGRVISALHRDLAESDRVGRELVGELDAARGEGLGSDELRGRLDTLAESAARGQADLQAAAWKIAQLERELSESPKSGGLGGPARAQVELEQALAAARDEVAALRRALGSASS